MFIQLVLIIASVYSSYGIPRPQQQQQATPGAIPQQPRQLLYVPQQRQSQQQQYAPDLQYDLGFLEPHFQQAPPPAGYNFVGNRQPYPRVQPQIILYHNGGAPGGQPFLLQPGGAPPGNFLVPQQPGPNVLVRNTPQRPVFIAGYPKPAHIPPIEKDAEEIPTNPSKIPPLSTKTTNTKGTESKPEKLETFNEDEPKKQPGSEQVPAARVNPFNANFYPGQRFFILNGQPLFSNYPYNNQIYPLPNPNLRYAQPTPQYGVPAVQQPAAIPTTKNNNAGGPIPNLENFFIRNGVTGQIDDVVQDADLVSPHNYPENLILLNQPGSFQDSPALFRSALPEQYQPLTKDVKLSESSNNGNKNDGLNSFELFQVNNDDQDNEAVIIDARYQDENPTTTENESEAVNAPEKSAEPTISQAAPGAIALAGPGGVAAAAPRGTAFVGKDGVAVSSPQATAVAGPSKDEETTQKPNKKPKRKQ